MPIVSRLSKQAAILLQLSLKGAISLVPRELWAQTLTRDLHKRDSLRGPAKVHGIQNATT